MIMVKYLLLNLCQNSSFISHLSNVKTVNCSMINASGDENNYIRRQKVIDTF